MKETGDGVGGGLYREIGKWVGVGVGKSEGAREREREGEREGGGEKEKRKRRRRRKNENVENGGERKREWESGIAFDPGRPRPSLAVTRRDTGSGPDSRFPARHADAHLRLETNARISG